MAVTPLSRVILLNTPFDIRNINQVIFSSQTAQQNYFTSTEISGSYSRMENASYIRADKNDQHDYIAYKAPYDQIESANYLMYQNTNYSNKWFYCFIERITYFNDNMSHIIIKADSWQTRQFNCSIGRCFVEREHTQQYQSNGLPYINTTTENFDFGDSYDVVSTQNVNNEVGSYWVCISSSIDLILEAGTIDSPKINSAKGGTYQGVQSALSYYLIGPTGTASIKNALSQLSNFPWVTQGIYSISYIPRIIGNDVPFTLRTSEISTGVPWTIAEVDDFTTLPNTNLVYPLFDNFPTFTNSKLNFFPYSYIEVSNYNGDVLILHPQNFQTTGGNLENNIGITVQKHFYIQSKVAYQFTNYNRNISTEGLNVSFFDRDYAQLPIQIDNYTLSIANNSNNYRLQNFTNFIGNSISAGTNLAYGNYVGALTNGYNGLRGLLDVDNSQKNAELIPPSLKGQFDNNAFNLATTNNGIRIKWKTIKKEYIARLEEYFNRYGYKVSTNKVPNLTNYHDNFRYVKTNGCIVNGQIPQEDKRNIINMFDGGVTLYDSPLGIGNI